ncbi:MAG TPA: sugar transferase [Vicinamibacterales bacterium]|nr:sugar transferase [Vicinamibacterales bacterium]
MSLFVTTDTAGTASHTQQVVAIPTASGTLTWTERAAYLLRRAVDVVFGSLALVLFAPVMLLIAILIKLDSPGPALFRQIRVGRNRRQLRCPEASEPEQRGSDVGGRPFRFYKFRTMYADARTRFPELYTYDYQPEDLEALPMKVLMGRKGNPERFDRGRPMDDYLEDPRVTRVGRWLRKSSLDELPNFWNVVRGDMHLVGPRPDIPENIRYYRHANLRKLSVPPGVTGLAQIRGRGLLSFQDTNAFDLEYVDNRSLWLDVRILFRTALAIVKRDGAF